MQFINDCNIMKQHFPCQRGCWNEVTNAIPSYCKGDKGYGGMCLISYDAFSTCNSKQDGTFRLCYCIDKQSRIVYTLTASGAKIKFRDLQFQLRACISPNFVY